ncbi:hypothetical protein NM208_g9713 [Fusarium decemcellulare]|uniref:Uncharacterized protein n=1 Tax=Fusarium decemcellulare TaxID=57161 RepID=A0ACC1S0K7_9HYPO|nr:hypothetical protein NM208_g9713 [Fusarium decemcellulare]
MSNFQDQVVPSGRQHYSGQNRVPNVRQFMEQLDQDKKARDAAIDEELKQNKVQGETKDHKNDRAEAIRRKKDTRKVRDPVTGKDVDIRDADLDFAEAVDNPQVSVLRRNCVAREFRTDRSL